MEEDIRVLSRKNISTKKAIKDMTKFLEEHKRSLLDDVEEEGKKMVCLLIIKNNNIFKFFYLYTFLWFYYLRFVYKYIID